MTLNMSHLPSSSSYSAQPKQLTSRGQPVIDTNSRGQRCTVSLTRHNSIWNASREHTAAENDAQTRFGHRGAAGVRLATNQIYGAAYEAHVARALARDPRFTDVDSQVMIVPNRPAGQVGPTGQAAYSERELKDLNKQAGGNLRTDFLAYNNGGYKNVECKSSDIAGFTANQRAMLSNIESRGAVVSAPSDKYDRRDNLGSVGTIVVRPNTEDGIFEQETLTPTAPPRPKVSRPEDPVYGRRW